MAQRGRSSFPTRSGSLRRKTSWTGGPLGRFGEFSSNSVQESSTVLQAILPGLTIVRIRGHVSLALASATAVNDGFDEVGIGLAVVSENAGITIGVTAIPAPIDDVGWDGWMWHWLGNIQAMNTGASIGHGVGNMLIPIDTKAMRKFKESDVLVAMIQVAGLNGTVGMQAVINTRTLLKLP